MELLLKYLNALDPKARADFAARCKTTVGYLRKGAYTNQRFGVDLCLAICTESGGAVPPQSMRPDLDWGYMHDALVRMAEVAA